MEALSPLLVNPSDAFLIHAPLWWLWWPEVGIFLVRVHHSISPLAHTVKLCHSSSQEVQSEIKTPQSLSLYTCYKLLLSCEKKKKKTFINITSEMISDYTAWLQLIFYKKAVVQSVEG